MIGQLAYTALKTMWVMANEYLLNIRTDHRFVKWSRYALPISEHDDARPYETIDFLYARKVIRVLDPGPDDVFYDVGCGMGRMLCLMARTSVKKVVGVELFPALCEIARQNALNLSGRKAQIEIWCIDASKANMSDGTMYFFFNPFGPETLNRVIHNIEKSLAEHPRKIKIVYYNAVHESVFNSFTFLKPYHILSSFKGQRVSFWCNTCRIP